MTIIEIKSQSNILPVVYWYEISGPVKKKQVGNGGFYIMRN
jgi:hypothetical protein